MAWNKPSEPKVEVKGGGGQRKVYLKGVLVGAVAVVVGVVCIFAFSGKSEKPVEKGEKTDGLIKEVTPSPAPKAAEEPRERTYKDLSRDEKIKMYEDRYGTNMPPNIRTVVYHLKHPPTRTFHPMKTRSQIFKNKSDRKIASILLVKPGNFMLRQPTFDENFNQDFVNNLFSNEEILDTDSPEDRELKQAVAATKKDLADLVRESGRKPSEIMNDEAKTLYDLGRYRRDLEKELKKAKTDGSMSDDDLRDFVTAANQMLKEKGLPGFNMPNLVARQASIAMAEQRAAKKAAKAAAEAPTQEKK